MQGSSSQSPGSRDRRKLLRVAGIGAAGSVLWSCVGTAKEENDKTSRTSSAANLPETSTQDEFFRPAEVTVVLAWDTSLVSADRLNAGGTRSGLSPREINRLKRYLLQFFTENGMQLHPEFPFARTYGRGEREPLLFWDPLNPMGTRILQTVNLSSWVAEPYSLEGENVQALLDVKQVVDRLRELTPGRREGKPYEVGPYSFLGAAPNWFTLPMQDFAPPGGPGGRPVPANTGATGGKHPRFRKGCGLVADAVTTAVASTLTNAAGGFSLTGTGDGHNVRIALFDTWPMDDPTGPWTPGQVAQNGLGKITRFRDTTFSSEIDRSHLDEVADGTLVPPERIFDYADRRARSPVVRTWNDCQNGGSPRWWYDGSDHGLFVAGILKDLAPAAELSVYRVMDGRTVPDFHDVAEAMHDAVDHLLTGPEADKPVIFNCSFVVGPQLESLTSVLDNIATDFNNVAGDWMADLRLRSTGGESNYNVEIRQLIDGGLLEKVPNSEPVGFRFTGEMSTLQELVGFLQRRNVLIVAAAGNDNCPEYASRPHPRFPAAIEGVLGVSASSDESGDLAAYSNLDDFLSPDDGITAIGGSVSNGASTGGLTGLFISEEVPLYLNIGMKGTLNTTGLARWSGTSFSTPVAAGFAACLWSEMSTQHPAKYAPAQDVLRALTSHQSSLPFKQDG